MLPQFPNFKELELPDADDVQRYTARYAPFSDFNFAGLWSWNIDSSVLLCELNGNLVVRLGAKPEDLVPFEKYAAAAQSLTRPASAARALHWRAIEYPRSCNRIGVERQVGNSSPASHDRLNDILIDWPQFKSADTAAG